MKNNKENIEELKKIISYHSRYIDSMESFYTINKKIDDIVKVLIDILKEEDNEKR